MTHSIVIPADIDNFPTNIAMNFMGYKSFYDTLPVKQKHIKNIPKELVNSTRITWCFFSKNKISNISVLSKCISILTILFSLQVS